MVVECLSHSLSDALVEKSKTGTSLLYRLYGEHKEPKIKH